MAYAIVHMIVYTNNIITYIARKTDKWNTSHIDTLYTFNRVVLTLVHHPGFNFNSTVQLRGMQTSKRVPNSFRTHDERVCTKV